MNEWKKGNLLTQKKNRKKNFESDEEGHKCDETNDHRSMTIGQPHHNLAVCMWVWAPHHTYASHSSHQIRVTKKSHLICIFSRMRSRCMLACHYSIIYYISASSSTSSKVFQNSTHAQWILTKLCAVSFLISHEGNNTFTEKETFSHKH